jgi:hypothetical protein
MSEFEEKILSTLKSLSTKLEELETRIPVRQTVSIRASDHSNTAGSPSGHADVHSDSEEQFVSGEDFQFDRRRSNRFSTGSGGGISAKDAGTKIERPKFTIKQTRVVDGVKEEVLQDSDILDYLDSYDHFFAMWKTVPANEGLVYTNEARVPIINIPPIYAKQICRRIKCMFDATDLTFCSMGRVQTTGRSWKTLTSKDLRKALGELVEIEVSHKGALDALRRIKFRSLYGPIDLTAFATYQHEFKKEVLRLQSGGRAMDKIQLKDIIVHAYPDRSYQSELWAQFGVTGVLVGDVQDFAINDVFDSIERHITSITKEGLRSVVNKFIRNQEAHSSFSPRTPGSGGAKAVSMKSVNSTALTDLFEDSDCYAVEESADHPYDESGDPKLTDDTSSDDWQMLVNAAISNGQKCSRVGKGPDGLLLCKFLGGPKETCIFAHPEEDYKLKGKGSSSAKPFVKGTHL